MADAPDVAVRKVIDAAIGSLTYGTDLFEGPVRPPEAGAPHLAVFCLLTGGPTPQMFVKANQGPDVKRSTVQVSVRGDVGEFATAEALALSIWTAVHRAVISGYMSVTCAQSEPVYIGPDDTEHPRWVVNVDTMREE